MSSVLISQQSVPKHWRNIGPQKRAGVLAPLFCLHSKSSIGVGEIPDLEILAEWCKKTEISIIQILPLNDVGWDFRPYDSQSAFAIDPMYLRIRSLRYAAIQPFQSELAALEKEFSNVQRFVDFRIKAKKMELLWKIFNHSKTNFLQVAKIR